MIKAVDWLVMHSTKQFVIDQCGYRKIKGYTNPGHKENAGWLVAWTIETLLELSTSEI